MRVLTFFESAPRQVRIGLTLLFTVVVGIVNELTGSRLSISIFFLIPIAFITWTTGYRMGVLFSFLSIFILSISDMFGSASTRHPVFAAVNQVLRTGLFVSAAWVLSYLKALIEEHKAAARTDVLTGIANRRAFYEAAQMVIARANRAPRPITVVYTDIDNFKLVNDRFGHLEGDRLLSLTAEIMRQSVREIDQVARLGGDEFVLLLSDTDAEGASKVMDRLRSDLTAMALEQGWPVTYSAGAVTFSRPPESVDEMITKADTLMYSVKQSGKDHIRQVCN